MAENTKLLPKQRESNLELFRIITMILIISHHYVVNSGLMTEEYIYSDLTSWRSMFLLLFGAWGKTGINCFMMITGYFMCKSQITIKKFVKLLTQIYFYKIIFYCIFLFTGYTSFSVSGFVKMILPVSSVEHNFIGCFLLFFLCIPFLNILIHNINQKQHICLIILMGVIYIFFGTVPTLNVNMNYVSWFGVIYFIASYIRLYPKKFFGNTKLWGVLSLISIILSVSSVIVCAFANQKLGISVYPFSFVSDSNTFLAVSTGITTFMFFKNMKIGYSKIINTISAATFGVLLIHANSDSMRKWLWNDLLDNTGMYGSEFLIIHAVGSVLGIFIICSLMDMLRIRFIEKPFLNFWDKKFSEQ